AALPGVALAGASAFSVWKLATSGLAEAMDAAMSGSMIRLGNILEGMSASGRQFVTDFMEVIPLLESFSEAAQGAFLDQINGRLLGWLNALAGLKPALRDVA